MASTISSFSLRPPSLSHPRASENTVTNKPSTALGTNRRKLMLLSLTAAVPILTARESLAEDIPLFGLRKSVKKAEEEAVKLVKEAEREIKTAETEIETAEMEIEEGIGFGNLAQAGAVAGAEVVGVLVATSIVNGILSPQK